MHGVILDFLEESRQTLALVEPDIVELGSWVMHGSPRSVFEASARSYIGIDWRQGPGVDRVGLAHEVAQPLRADLAICCQMVEHDPHWRLTLATCVHVVHERRGALIVTWAGPGTPEHELETAPQDPDAPRGSRYYQTRTIAEVAEVIVRVAGGERLELYTEYRTGTRDALLRARFV